MTQNVVIPMGEYYIEQESALCDIDPQDDEANHWYGMPRNRSINVLDDYTARHYMRFSKDELRRIYHLFN